MAKRAEEGKISLTSGRKSSMRTKTTVARAARNQNSDLQNAREGQSAFRLLPVGREKLNALPSISLRKQSTHNRTDRRAQPAIKSTKQDQRSPKFTDRQSRHLPSKKEKSTYIGPKLNAPTSSKTSSVSLLVNQKRKKKRRTEPTPLRRGRQIPDTPRPNRDDAC